MITGVYKVGYASFTVRKESGRLYVKNKAGESKAVEYAAYFDENEHLDLRAYMNITGKGLQESTKELEELGVVLVGHRFEIFFYDEETVDRFLDIIGAVSKTF